MSITDRDNEEVVHLPGFWTLVFKLALAASIPITMSIIGLMTWMVIQIFNHQGRLDLVEFQLAHSRSASAGNSNTNIITSDAAKTAASTSARTYLTTADVAEREKLSERTVTEYIAQGRIVPAPKMNGKAWAISAEYRILPQNAASSGIAATKSP